MPQNAPRDRYGRFRRRTPSCWNDRRNAQKNLKTYSKSRAGGRPVVEIETRIYKKKPAAPIVPDGDPLEDERHEKRRKFAQSNDVQNPEQPNSNGLRLWNHPTRKGTQQIRRILPPHKKRLEEMRERSQSIGSAIRGGLAKERGLVGQPSWKPRSGIVPSAQLLKMLKTRQNLQTEPQTYNRVGMGENKPPGCQNERISPRTQSGPNGGEAHPDVMEDDPFSESRIGEEAAIHQRPIPTPSPSPPLFCSVPPVTPMPEKNPIIKISSWPSSSEDSKPPRTERGASTPPPVFRFLSPVLTTRDTPTPTPRPNPKRRRSIPFRRAFLVPSVEAREMSTINETPLPEPQPRELVHCSRDDLDEPHEPRQVQQEPLQETRELVDRSCYNFNDSQGPRQTQQEPVPEATVLAHRSRRDSTQSQGPRQTQHDLVNDSGGVASRIVPPATNPTTETVRQQASHHSGKVVSDSDTESESEATWAFPVATLPQSPGSPSPTSSSPILPIDRARSRSIDSISEAGVLSESGAISESGALSDSEEPDYHATPELISDDSMSSPAHQNDAAVTPSPDDSFSADGYCLRVSKFDADGNKSTTRTINVPATYTFEQLHKGLLSAFCLPPNLRYNFGLLKLVPSDKERGHGYRRPYPRERLLLAGAWKKSFETNWRAGAIVIEQLMKEIEDDEMLDLWWSHERGVVWTHHIEFVGKRRDVGRAWCTGESGGGKIFFEKGS